jgi:hypothetical protein
MSHDQHRGARAPGPLVQPADRRVGLVDGAVRLLEDLAADALRYAGDSHRARTSHDHRLGREPLVVGLVVHALASLGWHKVQFAGGAGTLPCCQLSAGGFLPLGPRDTSCIPPNSRVLVYKPAGQYFGIILGVVPPALRDGRTVNPDWLVPGGQSGLRREALHRYPLASLYQSGGVVDWSGQRPLDATAMERGWIAALGPAIHIDDFQAFLRVHEHCGLFLNYWDGYARLAGNQLDLSSLVHEHAYRDDEGEAYAFSGCALYPWEALGLYAPGTDFTATYPDEAVQYTGAVAKIDLASGREDVQPCYRWQEYGGYLGQGHLRLLARPPRLSGGRRYGDPPAEVDEGLFCESVAVDGGYMLRSAKSVWIGRRVRIVVPRRKVAPEDPTGDDAAAGNYAFSGKFGGPPHALSDVKVPGDLVSMRRVAALDDLAAFTANWKALHPFHYHEADYRTAQEAAQDANFSAAQETVDFTPLEQSFYLPDPTPKVLAIDHRYSDAAYFERTSFLHFLDDGGVALCDGSGAELVLAGGHVRLSAPGDLHLVPGRDLIALVDQLVLRARAAIDLSSASSDVRLKAERNVQVLAGNGGTGGVLLESKATSSSQDYDGKYGEEVVSNGIVLRAPTSVCALLGGAVYVRTGGGATDMNSGDIVLDAGKGAGSVQVYGAAVNAYCSGPGLAVYLGPDGETSTVSQVYTFGPDACVLGAETLLQGSLTLSSDLVVLGEVAATGSIVTAGAIANDSGQVGAVGPNFGAALGSLGTTMNSAIQQLEQIGTTLHAATVVGQYYQARQVGADAVVPTLLFSYRDAPDADQYHTADLRWPERRWEQMARLGTGTGGHAWSEPAVRYAGLDLYPWPGRKKWTEDEAYLQLEELTMCAKGSSADRPGPYTSPQLADWTMTTMAAGWKLARPGEGD